MVEDLEEHWAKVDRLWQAYRRKENDRIPVWFACDEQIWLRVIGASFGDFYRDPRVHLKAQLEGKRWFYENVIGDMAPNPPDRWDVIVRLWMEEDEFFGCEVSYQDDDYAWAHPIPLRRDELLAHIADIDPEDRVRKSNLYRMYEEMLDLAQGLEYMGRPVHVVPPGRGTHGIFTKAAEIRGLEQICIDLYEAPDFAERLLWLVTEKTIGRIKAWRKLTGCDAELPSPEPWGFADDSLQMISAEAYERFVLPCHEFLFSAMTTGERSLHNCGHAAQHYDLWHNRLNVTTIDGPGVFVDHQKYLSRFGSDFAFNAQTDHSVLERGSEADVQEMMRKLITPGTQLPGQFNIVGFVSRETPLENIRACYAAGREFGVIEPLA